MTTKTNNEKEQLKSVNGYPLLKRGKYILNKNKLRNPIRA
jgi:hypothetical protein